MRFRPVGPKSRLVLSLSTASIEAYEGAVRSSKTITSILDFARFVRRAPVGEFAIVGRTERTVARNVIDPMVSMFGRRLVSYNRGTATLTLFGRTVYVVGANNEASRTKIQGMTLVGLYIDEAAVIPESFFNMAYTRLSVTGAKMWLTANPEGRSHWLLVNWLEKARVHVRADGTVVRKDSPIDLHRYTFTLDDNPFLDAGFVVRLKSSYTGIWFRRFILSEWTNAEGAIYDMWDDHKHVITTVPEGVTIRRRLIGVDYGTAGSAFVALALGLGSDRKLYVLDEWRHDASQPGVARWTDAELSKGLQGWLTDHAGWDGIFVDPSAASFRVQLDRERVPRVEQAGNVVVPGIRSVASLLAIGSLLVLQCCDGVISEFPEYVWDSKAAERGEDVPVKKDDHSMDALRYAVRAAVLNWGSAIQQVIETEAA